MPAEDYEVIVVDNGSPTPAQSIAGGFAPNVRLIETGRNLGFAGACHVGLSHARGDAIALLNPDCEVDPGWLPNVIRPLADETIGVVGSKIYYHGTRILQHAGALLAENAVSAHRGRGEEDAGQYDEPADVDYVTGAAMAVARRTIERERVGFLATAYHPVYYEDSELCLRA